MSEYWVSKKKYFCKYCDIYIADDAPSRQQHENGLRHKGNVERFIRGIYKTGEKQKKDREEDFNPEQRLEHFFEVFGWFHTQLAEETSIHKQYYSTHKPFGLPHAFEILKRKGLHSTSVKGMS